MDQIELACPYCAGRFPAETVAECRVIACPHCGRMVTVPAAPRQPIPPPPPDSLPPLALAASGTDAQRWSATRGDPPRAPFDLTEPTKTLVNRRGEPVPLRRLSPEERERYRRRLNLTFAAIGMAILAIALAVLLRVRP